MNILKIFFTPFLFLSLLAFLGSTIVAHAANPGTIASSTACTENLSCSQVLQDSSSVNFGCANCNVSVTDTALTGYAWGENIGWIKLNPPNGGVANSGGTLSGYAWGDNAGWINFLPTNATGVTINTGTGDFNGYAWSQNYGYIKFLCPGAACVNTTWRPLPPVPSYGGASAPGITVTQPVTITGSPSVTTTMPTTEVVTETPEVPVIQTYCQLNPNDPSCLIPAPVSGGGAASSNLAVTTTIAEVGPTVCLSDPETGECIAGAPSALAESASSVCVSDLETGTCILPPVSSSTQSIAEVGPTVCISDPETGECIVSESVSVQLAENDIPAPEGAEVNSATSGVTGFVAGIVTSVLPESVVSQIDGLTSILNTPEANIIIKVVTLVGLVAGMAVSVAGAMFLNPLSFSELILIPFRLWSLFLSAIGLKKEAAKWGTVYDSVTLQPLDPAYVVLMDANGNEVATAITDLDGRYGFQVDRPGIYTILANKTDYSFPSKKLAGHKEDTLHKDLYFGEPVEITEAGQLIIKNIPMDSLNFNWNEYAKKEQKLMTFYKARDKWIKRVSNLLFAIGFVVATIAYLVTPESYNVIILSLYVAILILKQTNILKTKKKGAIADANGPLGFAILRVYSVATNVEITHKVANKFGEFYCLVPNGTYTVRIERKTGEQTYEIAFVSEPIKVTDGLIKNNFVI